jgi:hypothetical protein
MNIEKRYQDILERLKKGHRVLDALSDQDIQDLNAALNEKRELKKVLCIVENTRTWTTKFEPSLIVLLSDHTIEKDTLIYTLNAARKHCIGSRIKAGERLSADFLMTLKGLISHPAPEVVEWTLRVVDECGPQGVFFYKDIKAIKPKFSWIFNKHRRAIVQLVDMFHKRWSSNGLEKSHPGST